MSDNAWGIEIGAFKRNEKENIPVYLPLNEQGFCLHYDDPSNEMAQNFIENVVLKFVTEFPLGHLQVHLFDCARASRFLCLRDLKDFNIFNYSNNPETASEYFKILDQMISQRDRMFTRRTPNLMVHNAKNNDTREPYHLVIINLDDFSDQQLQLKQLTSGAAKAGIFIIGFTTNPNNNNNKETREWLKNYYPLLHLENNQFSFSNETFEHAIFSQWFDFVPLHLENSEKDDIFDRFDAEIAAAKASDPQPDYLSVKIGATLDGNRPAELTLGQKTGCHHILLTGSTGSGKTALLNNLILRIGEKYDSDQFRLYLMDYKQGVEFQVFKDHPNVEQIYLDNQDITAAENMLIAFMQTCEERSKLFQQVGVNDLDEYNKATPNNPLPRKLLIIDEFQVMFGGGNEFENWERRAKINALLATIARQGRSFGVHLLLTTQSLLDVNLNDEIRAQIGLRMTFKLNDLHSARTVLQGDNADVALQLGQYQLLYNNQAGQRSGNQIIRTDAPENVAETIARIRTNRPANKCLTPKIMTSQKASNGYDFSSSVGGSSYASFASNIPNTNFSPNFDTSSEEALLKERDKQNRENEE